MIDCHGHFIPEEWIHAVSEKPHQFGLEVTKSGSNYALQSSDGIVVVPPHMYDLDTRLAELDKTGIDSQVIAPASTVLYYDKPEREAVNLARSMNEAMLSASTRSAGRLWPSITLPWRHPERALEELHKSGTLDICAIFVLSNILGEPLDDPRFHPLLAVAGEMSLPVLIHPPQDSFEDRLSGHFLRNLVGNPLESGVAAARLMASGALDEFPETRFLMTHGGGVLAAVLGRMSHGYANELVKGRSPDHYLDRFFVDSVVHDAATLEFIVGVLGSEHLVGGSDMPYPMGIANLQHHVIDVGFSPDLLDANALRILRVPSTRV